MDGVGLFQRLQSFEFCAITACPAPPYREPFILFENSSTSGSVRSLFRVPVIYGQRPRKSGRDIFLQMDLIECISILCFFDVALNFILN